MSGPNPVTSTPIPDTNAPSGRALRAGRATGRGRGYYRRGGRGYHWDTHRPRESAVSATTKFTGATKDMDSHDFQGFGKTVMFSKVLAKPQPPNASTLELLKS